MADDGLYKPLGQNTSPPRSGAEWRRIVLLGSGVLSLMLMAAWEFWQPGRHPDSPIAIAPIEVAASVKPAQDSPQTQQTGPVPVTKRSADVTLSGDAVEKQSGVTVIRPPGTKVSPGAFIAVPAVDAVALAPAPDARLVEKGRYGLLPRRGPDGTRPADVYARPPHTEPALASNAPRMALFVGGMGLDRMITATAAQALPPAVTLGFAPYGGDLAQQVENARMLGHEAVLQVPMESFNAPDDSNMPRMLTVADPVRETLDNLHWQMSRFAGYAGVASFLGGKFTADAKAFAPVLRDFGERGLFFFDDGTSPRNLSATLGPSLGLPILRADVVIDALGDPEAIDAGLRKLEATARSKGTAIGATTGLPTTVDRVAAFAAGLAARGIALVPLSALAADPSQRPSP